MNNTNKMANNWNITVKHPGLIGGVAKGSQEELQARIDSLDRFYTKGVAKIEKDFKASFIKATFRKKIVTEKPKTTK